MKPRKAVLAAVLILVLVEDGLGDTFEELGEGHFTWS